MILEVQKIFFRCWQRWRDSATGRELTGLYAIPILRRFPARWRAGRAGPAEKRGGPMMRDPGGMSRRSKWGRQIVPAASRRRR
jgi:hypothetical protein